MRCLVAIARHHELDTTFDGLLHEFAVGAEEPEDRRLLLIAKGIGLEARNVTLGWQELVRSRDLFPVLARLKNGNSVIIVGIEDTTDDPQVAVVDPLPGDLSPLLVGKDDFLQRWSGSIVSFKRIYRLTDEDQPFSLRWFAPEILRQKAVLSRIAVASLLLHLLALAVPVFFQLVIDRVLAHQTYQTLFVLMIGVMVAITFDSIFNFLRRSFLLFVVKKIDMGVASKTFSHLLSLPVNFFDFAPAGVLVKHMQQAEKIREFLTGSLFITVLDASVLLVFIPVLFMYSEILTAVVLVFAVLIAGVIVSLIGPFRRRLEHLYNAEGQRQALLTEAIHGMHTIKALSLEPRQQSAWDRHSANTVTNHFKVGMVSTSAQALTSLLEKLMVIVIVAVGAQQVIEGALSVGALVAFQMISARVSGPLVQIVSLLHTFQEALLSVRMLGNVMNSPSERAGTERGIRAPIRGALRFEGVSFNYAERSAPAVSDLSFDIPAGAFVGIVGASGSGKTTLARLVAGLYRPQIGIVRIDGQDIRQFDLTHLRLNVGIVLQDNFLFRGTVRENIAMTRTEAGIEDIVKVARYAGAEEFIERLPRGYDTVLEENGRNLSAGQKQRLAIARALLLQPAILIFDEATSALDPESEAIIQGNLAKIAAGRTLFMISHRLSTVKDADKILVLSDGKLVGEGKHAELLKTCERYASLWGEQTKHISAPRAER
ncbi:MAG: peptidase domain-containing ABC transporter [Alphaproteobacteria bacterium]|nr:peptidase domain-containing ABC transporter [Alphaproteobacteria bacterium]